MKDEFVIFEFEHAGSYGIVNIKFATLMKELFIENKEAYLKDNYPFDSPPKLDVEIVCIHCNTIYKVGSYTVFEDEDGDEYICCPNAPDCDGTVIDWIPIG